MLGCQELQRFLAHAGQQRGFDEGRTDSVDAYTFGSVLQAPVFGQAHHAVLGGDVGG
ncbi:hypothetical protein D9M68_1006230 [compost metagenome]